jgi:hypothetical protein
MQPTLHVSAISTPAEGGNGGDGMLAAEHNQEEQVLDAADIQTAVYDNANEPCTCILSEACDVPSTPVARTPSTCPMPVYGHQRSSTPTRPVSNRFIVVGPSITMSMTTDNSYTKTRLSNHIFIMQPLDQDELLRSIQTPTVGPMFTHVRRFA